MSDYITVSVSPFYNGRGWTDKGTGIDFEPANGINAIRIDFNKHKNLAGIANSIRLNNLLLLKGELPKDLKAEDRQLNPEELTKKELDVLMAHLKGQELPADDDSELAELKAENAALKAKIAELEAVLPEPEEADATEDVVEDAVEEVVEEEVAEDPAFVQSELEDMTKDELKQLAEENGVELKSSDTKAVIIQKIMETN